MDEIIILEREGYNITLNPEKEMFAVNLIADVVYDEEGFQEFLKYFNNTWLYVRDNSLAYYLFINLGICKKENELPLPAYIKLIKVITDLNDLIIKHCHGISILTEGSEKWENAYNLITKLWNPPEQRPLKFTQSQDEVDLFFKTNRLLK
jgi:hypothetical protein|tara:strand:+ start:110 stop:559 length:450 start_codon:yes stop_codon:yes gene_type:complete